MSFAPAHQPWPGAFPDRNSDSEASGKFPRPTHLPISASYQPPLHFFSQQISLEAGPVTSVSAAGSNPEQVAHKSTVYGDTHRDPEDCCDGWRFSASIRGQDERIPGCPLSLHISPSHPLSGKIDEPFPKFQTFGTIYTDDARMKLGNGIHRLCFNCRAAETRTWRRSKLNPGKMLCNKCGLFERTHSVPRPKTFPRRRRSRLTSVHQSLNPPPDIDRYNERPPIMAVTGHTLHAYNSIVCGETGSQHTSWMSHNTKDTSLVSPCAGPRPTDTPRPYCTDFQSPPPLPSQQYTSQSACCCQPM